MKSLSHSPLFLLFPFLLTLMGCNGTQVPGTTLELLEDMARHLEKADVDAYTFVQETIRFNEDGSPKDTLTWYEAMQFPDRFRIDFGELSQGNSVIYANDSVFHIRGSEVKHADKEVQEFMLLEGGLKEAGAKTTLDRLKTAGYDVESFDAGEFEGHAVWVIGANKADDKSKQVWIDQEKLTTRVRIDPREDGTVIKAVFDKFQDHNGLWIETWVEFYKNDTLLQTERYNEIEVRDDLDERLFSPREFGAWHWRK